MAREPYATPREVSEHLRVSVQTLYNWRNLGRGPRAAKVGGQLRYAWSDVEAYAQSGDGAAEPLAPSAQHGTVFVDESAWREVERRIRGLEGRGHD